MKFSVLLCGIVLLSAANLGKAQQAPAPREKTHFFNLAPASGAPAMQLKLKDLDASWFTFSVSSSQNPDAEYQVARVARAFNVGVGSGVYFSRGNIFKIADETFLVAYSVSLTLDKWIETVLAYRADVEVMGITHSAESALQSEPLTAESPLVLSLLKVRAIASMDSIVPFDLGNVLRINKALREADAKRISENAELFTDDSKTKNLRSLQIALQGYLADFDEKFPALENADVARAALEPYTKDKSIFAPLDSAKPYQPNPFLSNKKEFAIDRNSIVFYETDADKEGKRAVLMVNGIIKRVDETEWQRLKKLSKIP